MTALWIRLSLKIWENGMDKIETTYFVDYGNFEITRRVNESAKAAKIIHPSRCFDTPYKAKLNLIDHYKKIRDEATANVKKAYLVTHKNLI